MAILIDLTGTVFGKLKVLRRGAGVVINGRKLVSWVCRCDCGKEVDIPKYSLIRRKHGKPHCGCSPHSLVGVCGDCHADFLSSRLRHCRDGVLRCKVCTKQHTPMQYFHKLSLTAYKEQLSTQNGLCALCKKPPQRGEGRLVIDHDHATGKLRGLLCRTCNLLLGYLQDSPAMAGYAVSYLLRHNPALDLTANAEFLEWCWRSVTDNVPNSGEDKWDRRYLQVARLVSSFSKDPSTKTGAVIVRPDRSIASMGYNGFAAGVVDSPDRLNNREVKYKMVVHCERNAIIFAQQNLRGSTLYTWPFMSCAPCAGMVIQAGITRCVAPRNNNPRWVSDFEISKTMFSEANVQLDFVGETQQ